MSKVVKRTFSLTEEQAAFIDAKIESGGYASGSEVVREGLRGLQENAAALERWIQEEVLPTLKELEEDPSRAQPIDEAFEELMAEIRQDEEDREELAKMRAARRRR